MRKLLLLLSVVLVALCVVPAAYPQGGPEYAPDQVIVKFGDRVPRIVGQAIAAVHGLRLLEVGYGEAFHVFVIPPNVPLGAVIATLSRNPNVEYAEPNGIAYTCEVNDPYFVNGYQWNFYNRGTSSVLGTSNYGIEAPKAWALTTGSGVTVAVVDTGVAYNAPDLAGTSFDLLNDYDFANNDDDAYDDNGHGTHVCGTVAQTTNNSEGCAGIAYGATILPVKVLDASGSGYYSWVASGIRWAADHGAKVINLSLGGSVPSTVLKSAVDYAVSKGCVVVAAAGNNNANTCLYPARYPNCVAVGATNFSGRRAWYSNYGKDIDVVAPGGDTRSDYRGGIVQQSFTVQNGSYVFGYFWWQGTSMATPHVSGVAALVRSYNPGLSVSQVRTRIQTYGIPPANKYDWSNRNVKIVNAYGAVTGTTP